jgi:hypothetical protein
MMSVSGIDGLHANLEQDGFGLKADLKNPRYKFVSETTFLQAVNWFEHFLSA